MKHHYLVIQVGARMHYAVPALLAKAGLLKVFYTDIHSDHFWLEWMQPFAAKLPKPLKRLLARKLPESLPKTLVHDRPLTSLLAEIANKLAIINFEPDKQLFNTILRKNFLGATALYTNFINNDLALIREAKRMGIFCVHELIIGADVGRILWDERQLFPGVEKFAETKSEIEAGIEKDLEKWAVVDKVLVPSQYCYDSCKTLGADPSKLFQVPYGIHESWFNIVSEPEQGRVLCVGQVGLRKGIHYLAHADRLLKQRNFKGTVRVAGPWLVDPDLPLFQGPVYLGQIPRPLIVDEFRYADVFVLPTLADSFGLVHLEAMACGVPVITTPNCGSIIRDGIDGFIVPIRDALTLADKIEQIVCDRQLREYMAKNARERALQFTWRNYERRLIEALL